MKFSMYKRSSLVEHVFLFSTEIWAEQLKKAPCIYQLPCIPNCIAGLSCSPAMVPTKMARLGAGRGHPAHLLGEALVFFVEYLVKGRRQKTNISTFNI